ncbi:MAG: hypothetical protein AB3N17_05370, partial [Tateyamaria sp.]
FVTDSTVHIVDFKTNRAIPASASEVPEGVLRQMGAYAHAMTAIYPDHTLKLSILWTQNGILMPLTHDIVTAALSRTPYLDVDDPGT